MARAPLVEVMVKGSVDAEQLVLHLFVVLGVQVADLACLCLLTSQYFAG